MADMTLLAFAMVAFVGIATPAPTVLLALSDGSKFGIPCTLTGMARAILSDFVLIGAVALGLGLGLGLGALLAASEFWFNVVKWVGVCYLVFLASCCFAPEASSTARCNRQIGTGQHPRARSSSKHSGRGDQPQGLSVLFCFPAAVHQPFSAANSAICGACAGLCRHRFHRDVRICPAGRIDRQNVAQIRRPAARPDLRRRAVDACRLSGTLSPG